MTGKAPGHLRKTTAQQRVPDQRVPDHTTPHLVVGSGEHTIVTLL